MTSSREQNYNKNINNHNSVELQDKNFQKYQQSKIPGKYGYTTPKPRNTPKIDFNYNNSNNPSTNMRLKDSIDREQDQEEGEDRVNTVTVHNNNQNIQNNHKNHKNQNYSNFKSSKKDLGLELELSASEDVSNSPIIPNPKFFTCKNNNNRLKFDFSEDSDLSGNPIKNLESKFHYEQNLNMTEVYNFYGKVQDKSESPSFAYDHDLVSRNKVQVEPKARAKYDSSEFITNSNSENFKEKNTLAGFHTRNNSTSSSQVFLKKESTAENQKNLPVKNVEISISVRKENMYKEIDLEKSPNMNIDNYSNPSEGKESKENMNHINITNLNDANLSFLESAFCMECMVDTPIRARHCRSCGKCVATFDHHCGWIANCIGERNKWKFQTFLFLHSVFILICILYVNF